MIKRILHFLNVYIFSATNSKKIKYLKKKGANLANDAIIYSNIDAFGSEPYLICIGSKTTISSNVTFFTHDGGMRVLNNLNKFEQKVDKLGKIEIGENCFIGAHSIILPNVKIGDNCIIGAGAVVTKSFPENSVIAGVPAKSICSIDDYYEKNKNNVHFTKNMSYEDKRKYCESNFRESDNKDSI